MRVIERKPLRAIVMAAAMVAIAGCVPSSTNSAPRVENCAVVSLSSPPKYACGDKVYTAAQLAKIRIEEAKKHQSGN